MASGRRKHIPRSSPSRSAVRTLGDARLEALMRLVSANRFAEIVTLARTLLSTNPRQPLAQKALSYALIGLFRHDEALEVLNAAIAQSPGDGELYNNRGIALSATHRWDESMEDFNRARKLMPEDPELLKNIGMALARLQRWDEAIPILLQAIDKHPGDYVEAVALLADCLFDSRRLDEAWTCYQELYAADKANLGALVKLLATGLRRGCWDGLPEWLAELREKSEDFTQMPGEVPLASLWLPGVSPREHRRIAAACARSLLPSGLQRQLVANHFSDRATRKLTIAYLSGDLRDHAVGHVIVEVLERHDRTRFNVVAYSTALRDESQIGERLSTAVDQWVDVSGLTSIRTAERIRGDAVDILIDLAGWTSQGRPEALALRCAPVQMNWLGYPGTLGSAVLADYVVGDPVVTPLEDADNYAEAIAQLPFFYLPYDTTRLPGGATTREEHGLTKGAFVFCSFNAIYKYNPPLFDLWCRILREAENSVLWLGHPGDSAASALGREAAARGVAPERLVFAPRVDDRAGYLARIGLADLALDPFPYNSHSTGLDTLWAGVPLVALRGDTFAGRVGASMLTAAGVSQLIAESVDDYRALALGYYRDARALASVRSRIRAARCGSPLFDMPMFVRNLEGLYSQAWRNHLAGQVRPMPAGSYLVDDDGGAGARQS